MLYLLIADIVSVKSANILQKNTARPYTYDFRTPPSPPPVRRFSNVKGLSTPRLVRRRLVECGRLEP